MGKRSTSRRVAMQALYQAEYGGIDIKESLKNIFEQEKLIDEAMEFSTSLAEGAYKQKDEIDLIIKKYLKDWKIGRMAGVDLNILRLAFYELIYTQTPLQIVINEAVEMAKKYSTLEAAKFINGILGAYKKEA
ncbi:MAG: transcription antitermination factor NusB [Candidatus Saganbacteria bacterium]|uniref:Transcription antitermination protein NusB n=1 Tax=Candidatus Saganbacteria bacterium TaxID=2575572 RepID=A0A833L078_UNCSA|nr:MAG: transcription antitermination factor NusB [Candidatus Saganbacteria bacterium]